MMSDLSEDTVNLSNKIAEFLSTTLKDSKIVKKFFDDLYCEFQSTLDNYIEGDQSCNYRIRVSQEITRVINGILSGNECIIKSLELDTEYTFDDLHNVRLKIWETCSNDIQNSIINAQNSEIKYLRDRIESLEKYR